VTASLNRERRSRLTTKTAKNVGFKLVGNGLVVVETVIDAEAAWDAYQAGETNDAIMRGSSAAGGLAAMALGAAGASVLPIAVTAVAASVAAEAIVARAEAKVRAGLDSRTNGTCALLAQQAAVMRQRIADGECCGK
jgi:hypothetical protein